MTDNLENKTDILKSNCSKSTDYNNTEGCINYGPIIGGIIGGSMASYVLIFCGIVCSIRYSLCCCCK